MDPSYARPQKVVPMKSGRIGMMILDTRERTIFWNSSNSEIARFIPGCPQPYHNRKYKGAHDRHDLRDIKLKNHFRKGPQSTYLCGDGKMRISIYPPVMEKKAAPMEEAYASKTAIVSIREALFPSFVMEGAIKPMMISGTQN